VPVKFEFDIVSMLRVGLGANVRFELEQSETEIGNSELLWRKRPCAGKDT
jgi:hypothetical protein